MSDSTLERERRRISVIHENPFLPPPQHDTNWNIDGGTTSWSLDFKANHVPFLPALWTCTVTWVTLARVRAPGTGVEGERADGAYRKSEVEAGLSVSCVPSSEDPGPAAGGPSPGVCTVRAGHPVTQGIRKPGPRGPLAPDAGLCPPSDGPHACRYPAPLPPDSFPSIPSWYPRHPLPHHCS